MNFQGPLAKALVSSIGLLAVVDAAVPPSKVIVTETAAESAAAAAGTNYLPYSENPDASLFVAANKAGLPQNDCKPLACCFGVPDLPYGSNTSTCMATTSTTTVVRPTTLTTTKDGVTVTKTKDGITVTKTTTGISVTTVTTTVPASVTSYSTSSSAATTTTSTSISSCPTPTCSSGIDQAVYENPFTQDTNRNYPSFNIDYFKTAKPVQVNVTDRIQIMDRTDDPLWYSAAAEYRGFLYTCQDGEYTFNSRHADDITLMWFGDKGYEGWTRKNADIIQFFYNESPEMNVTKSIKAGKYYPIRVMWGNTGGFADLSLKIFGPDGSQLVGSDGTSYITTEACDGSYPPYPPFGKQSSYGGSYGGGYSS